MKNISKAIISVMKSVKGMEKNMKVGKGNYAYNGTSDKDVKEVFNEALAENGLCILPISVEDEIHVERYVDQYGKPKMSVMTVVKTKYLLLHDSGESIELAGYGQGVDSQDKGAGKATTYALKNCLLYTFLTPVGKIDDTDTTHSEEIATPPAPAAPKPPAKKKLTKDQFESAVGGTKVQIQTVLDKFTMTATQKATLQTLVKDA
jgi:hypothetical protein